MPANKVKAPISGQSWDHIPGRLGEVSAYGRIKMQRLHVALTTTESVNLLELSVYQTRESTFYQNIQHRE